MKKFVAFFIILVAMETLEAFAGVSREFIIATITVVFLAHVDMSAICK